MCSGTTMILKYSWRSVYVVDINLKRAKRWICVQICINNLQPRQPRVWMTGRLWLCTKQLSESQKWASADRTRAAQNANRKWWIPHTRPPKIQLDASIKNSHASHTYNMHTLESHTYVSTQRSHCWAEPVTKDVCKTRNALVCCTLSMQMGFSQHLYFTEVLLLTVWIHTK
jgi:hypothetical protein